MAINQASDDGIYGLEGRVLDSLERVDINGDSVLIIKAPDSSSAQELQPFAKFIKTQVAEKYGYPNILVVVMTDDMSIEALDPEQMAKYGWVKASEPSGNPTFH